MGDELAVCGVPDPEPVSERNRLAHLDPDERGDGGVDALVPEHRLLELRVRPVEGVVVPVETAARLGDVGHKRQQDGSEERVLGLGVRMSTGEDRRGRLASEGLERDRRVAAAEQASAPSLDEAPDERTVLVERGSSPRAVLFEDERDLGALLDLAPVEGEGAEAEAAQGRMEVRCAHLAHLHGARGLSSLARGAPVRDPVRIALAARGDRAFRSADTGGRPGGRRRAVGGPSRAIGA